MTDLFTTIPAKPMRIGAGNAAFLCDLTDNVPDATMSRKTEAGDYGPLNPRFAQGWRKLFGRT